MAPVGGIRGWRSMAVIIFGLFLGLGILAPPKAIAAGAEKVNNAMHDVGTELVGHPGSGTSS